MKTGTLCRNCKIDDKTIIDGMIVCINCGGLIFDSQKTSNQNQRKKDKDDGSNVSLSDNPKQLQRKTNKDEHMSASVDKYVDTDAPTNPSLDEVSRIDGRRLSSKLNDRIDS
jgi:transcription initiation factor TFIIIB Brf1 subunit/transcription initiation factor TFIIB